MLKSSMAGLLGVCAMTAVGSTPAAAWGWGGCCGCYPGYGYSSYYGYGGYGAYAVGPPAFAYTYSPRVAYYQAPGAYYYAPVPPAPVYGYAYVNRGPAAVIVPPRPRIYRGHGWGW